MTSQLLKWGFAFAMCSSTVCAQGIAHSDVFFTYNDAKIEVERQDGRLALPQIMPVGGFFAQANTNPGFFSERDVGGGTDPNDIVGYNVLDDILFWSEGEFSTPNSDTSIRILNNPRTVEDTFIGTGTGEQRANFDQLSNSIGQSSSAGDFHSHVDFRLEPNSSDPEETPLMGAYGLKLSLSSDNPAIEESDPFFIVFRFGLEEDLFAQALDDFEAILSAVEGLPGDFNADGMLTGTDIDLLSVEVQAGTNNAAFDLNADAIVDELDRTTWIGDLAGSLLGDADLDGSVQFSDFLALSASFGAEAGWADGDFDGNGQVQFPDFLALSSNFGATPSTAAVPEPTTFMPLAFAFVLMANCLRRRTRLEL